MVSPAVFTVLIGLTFIQTHLNFNSKAIGTIYYSRRDTDYTTVSVSRPRAKRFILTWILYRSNGISTFQLEKKLLACGYVEPNPGPEKTNASRNILVENVAKKLKGTKTPYCVRDAAFGHTQFASSCPNKASTTISYTQKLIGPVFCVPCPA